MTAPAATPGDHRVLGLILDPASTLPGWLAFVLMPLFGFIMWVALKPFRRLTTMVSPHSDRFTDAAGSIGTASASAGRWTKKALGTAAAAAAGGVAGAVTAEAMQEDHNETVPERAEARPAPVEPQHAIASTAPVTREPSALSPASDTPTRLTSSPLPPAAVGNEQSRDSAPVTPPPSPALEESPPPAPVSEETPPPPTEPEWYDGEEVYAIYRPSEDPGADDAA